VLEAKKEKETPALKDVPQKRPTEINIPFIMPLDKARPNLVMELRSFSRRTQNQGDPAALISHI
jgi:hypothetical protein